MAQLFDLPVEVFEDVIGAIAQAVPLHDLFRLRTVCRTFANGIKYQLLARTSIQVYLDYNKPLLRLPRPRSIHTSMPRYRSVSGGRKDYPSQHSAQDASGLHPGLQDFLTKHFECYLLNHINNPRLANPELPQFIHRTANELMEFAPSDAYQDDLRKAHVQNLVHALVIANETTPRLMLGDGAGWHINPVVFDRKDLDWTPHISGLEFDRTDVGWTRNMTHIKSDKRDVEDMLAAAAATGIMEAVQYYISQGAMVLDWKSNPSKGFGSSLQTATSTGKIEVLRALLSQADHEIADRCTELKKASSSQVGLSGWLKIQSTIESAIACAMKARNTEAAIVLFKFLSKYDVNLLVPTKERVSYSYLADAMSYGHLELVQRILDREPNSRSELVYRKSLLPGLRRAVRSGHVDIVKYLFDNKFVDPQTAEGNPIGIAAEYGHRTIIVLALDHGAKLEMHHLLSALHAPLGNSATMALTVELLLDHGVPIKSDAVDEDGKPIAMEVIEACEAVCRSSSIEVHLHGRKGPVRGRDKILMLVRLALEMKKQIPGVMLTGSWDLSKLLEKIAYNWMSLPKEPILFLEVAKELHHWIQEYRHRGDIQPPHMISWG
ncbi:uncharacterized protein K460DRAFT_418502 [Cucurbitaria berberidis CBS 394.84]|uniref:F-box domain-containing protein n=1 Tax=Cucurbitaria berberidis CBS 394.84 TaxID=1168544 RepID=A0A9P4L5Z1_9PLEO|nr:uncharacterized protein K460DRAFT_418502 [Cucurbitaria berberidis CBS 394.84]KAF1843441.1 hypothetical protein K460DRAFT_418502 [Cucurbitaria berberidis CBS 394.84]